MFGSSFASIASSLFSLEHSFIYSMNRVIKHLLCARHCDSMLEFAAVKALLSLSKLVRYWAFSTEPLIFFLLLFICSSTLLYFLKDVHGFIFQIVSWLIFNFNSFFFSSCCCLFSDYFFFIVSCGFFFSFLLSLWGN